MGDEELEGGMEIPLVEEEVPEEHSDSGEDYVYPFACEDQPEEEEPEETTEEYLARVNKEFKENNVINHLHKNVYDLPDSLEIFSPSQGGALKVYIDADDISRSESRLVNAMQLRKFAQDKAKDIFGQEVFDKKKKE